MEYLLHDPFLEKINNHYSSMKSIIYLSFHCPCHSYNQEIVYLINLFHLMVISNDSYQQILSIELKPKRTKMFFYLYLIIVQIVAIHLNSFYLSRLSIIFVLILQVFFYSFNQTFPFLETIIFLYLKFFGFMRDSYYLN